MISEVAMPEPVALLFYIAAVFALAGLIKGVIGLGLPTVAMGLLGSFMPPAEAAAILLLPSFVTNLWQLLVGPRFGPLRRRLWPMMLAIFAGTIGASGFLAASDAAFATAGLGASLVIYAFLGYAKLRMLVPRRAEVWAGPVVGVATGVVTGATGVFVIPAVPYLAGLGLDRDDLVQALGLSFTVSTIALGCGLLWHDAVPAQALGTSLLATAPALIGMTAGGWLRQHVQPETFRRWFFIGLAVLGLQILWQAYR